MNAKQMHKLLQPGMVEKTVCENGKTYRIYDDGNHIIGHIFSIEELINGGWWKRVSKLYTEWKDVWAEYKVLCGHK